MKRTYFPFVVVTLALTIFLPRDLSAQDAPSKNPVEIGTVNWGRDLDAAFATSNESGKPVLLLFQEVPGCAGCQEFGNKVLSQPLLVEAIEDEFVPVVVFNNRSSGEDNEILKRFNEPAWNYQVVRFLDGGGKDILPRKDKVWSIDGIAGRMIETLEKQKRPVPKYLRTIQAVSNQSKHDQVAFAMHCFWTGEYKLGGIDGVIATEAGWFDGREVTLVKYDKDRLSLDSLANKAAQVRCAEKVYTKDGRSVAGLSGGTLTSSYRTAPASDQKKQISRWAAVTQLPTLNAMQLTKINALAPKDMRSALEWLSPRQLAALGKK